MAGIQAMATSLKMVKSGSEQADLVIAHITSIGEQASEAEEIDVTTLDSPNRSKEFIQGAKDPGSIEVAVNNILGNPDRVRTDDIPSVIYTNPEIASVGESEQSAKEKGIDVIVRTLPMQYSGRYVAENEGGRGLVKIIVDKRWNTLIGVHIIANYASELILSAATMVEARLTVDEIKKIVFPHPTVGEIIKEAIWTI